MAAVGLNFVLEDLQKHLRTADLDASKLSTIARNGDDKLVEQFLTEAIFIKSQKDVPVGLSSSQLGVLQSQLYIACFWGFKDIVKMILDLSEAECMGIDVNAQNKQTLWTPLHAATFQEHGPIIMLLLERGARPELEDAEHRSPKDFASASDRTWALFQMLGYQRTPRHILMQMGIVRKPGEFGDSVTTQKSVIPTGLTLANYESVHYEDGSGGASGDVLANESFELPRQKPDPAFNIYR